MVVVLGKVPSRQGGFGSLRCLYIFPVRLELCNKTVDHFHSGSIGQLVVLYLPICPTRRLWKNGVQLKLCGSLEAQTVLPLRSYLRIDTVAEVPLEILVEKTRSDGLTLMFQEKSLNAIQNSGNIIALS
jgi:hypothetical protein